MIMLTLKAINPTHQKTVNKYLTADRKHVDLEDTLNAEIDGAETDKQIERLEIAKDRKMEKTYNRIYDLWELLPAREPLNLNKQYAAHFGYGCQMGNI